MNAEGRELARVLWAFAGTTPAPIILAVHGGSPAVAAEVARALDAPLALTAVDVQGRTVIVVDDGKTPFRSVRATLREARRAGAARIVVATAMADAQTLVKLARHADQVVCTHAVGEDEAQALRETPAAFARRAG